MRGLSNEEFRLLKEWCGEKCGGLRCDVSIMTPADEEIRNRLWKRGLIDEIDCEDTGGVDRYNHSVTNAAGRMAMRCHQAVNATSLEKLD